DEQRLKVGHNLKYDLLALKQSGLELKGPLFDTLVAAFVLEPNPGSLKLDNLAERLFAHTMIPITDLIGKGRDQIRLDQVPLPHATEYAAEDADYTWRLYQLFSDSFRNSDMRALFYDTEMPLLRVLAEMEQAGISLDANFLGELGRKMRTRCDELI